MSDFQAAYDRIQQFTDLHTQIELAELLEVRQSSISDAQRRKNIPVQWLFTLLEKQAINPAWIRTGEGPQYLAGSDGQPPLPPDRQRVEECLEPVLRSALLSIVPELTQKFQEALNSSASEVK